eukprot:GHRR01031619.1.p1 GENE.GHRR01031619.1~~GHRR01031619.1.p1  ORF type:complete len:112 (+),score=15.86 GHRR01031619.1:451-786(+)
MPPKLSNSTSSLMVMLGEVFVKSMLGSMRLKSRGCSLCSRSRSRRFMRKRRTAPASSSRNTCSTSVQRHNRLWIGCCGFQMVIGGASAGGHSTNVIQLHTCGSIKEGTTLC